MHFFSVRGGGNFATVFYSKRVPFCHCFTFISFIEWTRKEVAMRLGFMAFLALLVVIGLWGFSVETVAAFSGCGGVNPSVINGDYEQQVVELVNNERLNYGLPPLKRVTELDNAARYHAYDMGQDNYFNHDTFDGATLVCDTWTRVISYYGNNWLALAENIAAGQTTPQSVMTSWMNSQGHRDNILNASNWEIGVGYYQGSGTYYRYWVQDFGRRNNIYPVIINREAAATNSRTVQLYIYGAWQDMQIQNDNGTWSNWIPFQNNYTWTIANGIGDHTVTVHLRNGATIVTSTDTIYSTVNEVPTLGNIPDSISFVYSIPDQSSMPGSAIVTPLDVGTGATITWTLATQGTWFNVSPMNGSSPAFFTITPSTFDKNTVATYSGAVTVTVTSPLGVANSPRRINLTLQLVPTSFKSLNLPFIKK
jgi:uncharacterized protein YkwD